MSRKKDPLTALKAEGNSFVAKVFHAGWKAGFDAAQKQMLDGLTAHFGKPSTKTKRGK